MKARSLPYPVQLAILFAVYFATAEIGLSMDSVSGFATPFWPPTGIALVALCLFGYRLWPAITLAAFVVNVIAAAPLDGTVTLSARCLSAAGMAVGNTLEAVVGAALLRRAGVRFSLERLHDVVGLLGLAAILSTLISATIGVFSGWLGGVIDSAMVGRAWYTWWLGDMLGNLVIAPLLFVWLSQPRIPPRNQWAEAGLLLLGLLLAGMLLFGDLPVGPLSEHAYFLFPFLIWAAVRFGPTGAATATFFVALLAIAGTVQRWGPFAHPTMHMSLLQLQAFMGIAAVTSMILGAVTEERQHARAALAASARRFRGLIEHSADGVILLDAMGTYLYCSPSVTSILGFEAEELLGQDAFARCHPEDRQGNQELFGQLLSNPGRLVTDEYRYRHKDGTYRWLEGTGANWLAEPAIGGIVVNFRDITERKQAEERLWAALREKESLLKEVHHRVKNNLAIIDSLLRLQAGNLRDPALATAMRESRNRIRSMASIHESLYQSRNLARIDFATYIENLCHNLFRSYGVDGRRVSLRLEVAHVELDLEQAIPLGLLLNELVSNALKHAFPDNRCGTICVSLRRTDDGRIELTVADDGVGFPPDIATRRTRSLGLELVELLTEQISADRREASNGGTSLTITFLPAPAKESVGLRR